MIDVGGDDRATPGQLAPNELGGKSFAQRDELHLGGDLAAPGVAHLGNRAVATEDGPLQAGWNQIVLSGRSRLAIAGTGSRSHLTGGDPRRP